MRIVILISLISVLLTSSAFAKRGLRGKQRLDIERLRMERLKPTARKTSTHELIRTNLMKDISLRDSKISEKEVLHFLMKTSSNDKSTQAFYTFMIKNANRADLKHIKALFVNWIVLNKTTITEFSQVGPQHLSSIVRELSHKEIVQLSNVFESASMMLKNNKKLTPDQAFHSAMKENGVKAERLRKCKR